MYSGGSCSLTGFLCIRVRMGMSVCLCFNSHTHQNEKKERLKLELKVHESVTCVSVYSTKNNGICVYVCMP